MVLEPPQHRGQAGAAADTDDRRRMRDLIEKRLHVVSPLFVISVNI
jgi:hypothetical protein